MRNELDHLRPTRVPRGGAIRDYRGSEGAWRDQPKASVASLNAAQVKKQRTAYCARFSDRPPAIDIAAYRGIDQGQEGACSLVALIHVVLFTPGAAARLFAAGLNREKMMRSWAKFWHPELISKECAEGTTASPDLASTIVR